MMEYFEASLTYLYFVVEYFLAAFLFFSSAVRKPSYWKLLGCFGGASIGLCPLFGAFHFWIPGWSNLNFIAYSLLGVLLFFFLLLAHDERKKKIFFSAFAGVCVRMGGSWFGELALLFLPDIGSIWPRMIRFAIILLTYIPIYFTLGKIVREDLNFEPSKGELTFLIIAITALFPMAYFNRVVGGNLALQIYLLVLLTLIPYMLLAFEAMAFRHFRNHYQSELERESVAAQLSQYESMDSVISSLNIKIHDLKHQLAAGNGEEAVEGIGSSISEYEDFIRTGYARLDTILTEKKILASRLGIPFKSVVDGKRFEFLKLEDLVSLFSNLLDNAIEATKGQGGDKFIAVYSSLEGNFLCLKVENSCQNAPVFAKNGMPRTSKKDRSMHGFGTQSIVRVAEKYGGLASFSWENEVFQAVVLFQRQEEKPAS